MNIPQVYREKIASSVVGTPGVDTSGQAIGEAVAQPAFELAEKQQAMKDEALFGGARRVMPARKPGDLGNILENNRADFYKAAGSDRTVLAVELRLLGAGGSHSALGRLHPGLRPGRT